MKRSIVTEAVQHGRLLRFEPVKVLRYIWHVSYPKHRASIYEKGLLPIKGLLFANNLHHDLLDMWTVRSRFNLEYPDTEWELRQCLGTGLDFWQIDTFKTVVKWYMDPYLAYEHQFWGLKSPYHYVCTPDKVEPRALKLFTFDPEMEDRTFLRWGDGVCHVRYNHLPLKRAA